MHAYTNSFYTQQRTHLYTCMYAYYLSLFMILKCSTECVEFQKILSDGIMYAYYFYIFITNPYNLIS